MVCVFLCIRLICTVTENTWHSSTFYQYRCKDTYMYFSMLKHRETLMMCFDVKLWVGLDSLFVNIFNAWFDHLGMGDIYVCK